MRGRRNVCSDWKRNVVRKPELDRCDIPLRDRILGNVDLLFGSLVSKTHHSERLVDLSQFERLGDTSRSTMKLDASMHIKRVGIVLFNDIEVLDFCGPFEVFSAVRLNEERRREEHSPFEVLLVAERAEPVTTTGGMSVLPHHTFETCPKLDIVLCPGGWGTRRELTNPIMLEWLRKQAVEAETLAAVCTGSMVLGFAGLLNGKRATTHWRSLDWMRDSFPTVSVEYEKHFVQDGSVFTSAGISAGIDMSLKLVEHYFGKSIAIATARYMEYPYPENDQRRIRF